MSLCYVRYTGRFKDINFTKNDDDAAPVARAVLGCGIGGDGIFGSVGENGEPGFSDIITTHKKIPQGVGAFAGERDVVAQGAPRVRVAVDLGVRRIMR